MNFKNFKVSCRSKCSTCRQLARYSIITALPMHYSQFFWVKPIARLILKHEISGSHTISHQSLLLSTTILNDIRVSNTCNTEFGLFVTLGDESTHLAIWLCNCCTATVIDLPFCLFHFAWMLLAIACCSRDRTF